MEFTAKKEMMKYAIEYKSDGGINVNDDGRDDKKILNELENLLDWLVSICISDDMTELFKRVCRHFYYQYPELITDYVYLYKEMYEDDED